MRPQYLAHAAPKGLMFRSLLRRISRMSFKFRKQCGQDTPYIGSTKQIQLFRPGHRLSAGDSLKDLFISPVNRRARNGLGFFRRSTNISPPRILYVNGSPFAVKKGWPSLCRINSHNSSSDIGVFSVSFIMLPLSFLGCFLCFFLLHTGVKTLNKGIIIRSLKKVNNSGAGLPPAGKMKTPCPVLKRSAPGSAHDGPE